MSSSEGRIFAVGCEESAEGQTAFQGEAAEYLSNHTEVVELGSRLVETGRL